MRLSLAGLTFFYAACAFATEITGNLEPDIASTPFQKPTFADDYIKQVAMVPMRDGIKLYTVIVIPKSATHTPIILTRTPYNAKVRSVRSPDNPSMHALLPLADEEFFRSGFIRVYQDVRGKYGSGGDYFMTRAPIGPLNTTKTDESTDAYDTIDWLVKNVPQSNGKVGMIGSSYDGFTVTMALLNPHPALKAAVPESPMVDGWMGDDVFHYGAYRNVNFDYFARQTEQSGVGASIPRTAYDDYEEFLSAGSAGSYARMHGLDQLPYWRKILEHPAYDAFWQLQAVDKLLAHHPSDVPTLWEQGLWDHEDMWGAVHCFEALKAAGHLGNNFLVMGPWYHSQVREEGRTLGVLKWNSDTSEDFREKMVLPFFEQYLNDGLPAHLAKATIYNPAEDRWQEFSDWPLACETGCSEGMTPIYATAAFGLSFQKPTASGSNSYVSDPSKPVPYLPRPIRFSDADSWRTWLVHDQRFVDGRPDVLMYETEPLKTRITIQGTPIADIVATLTGSDVDFVVRLIDVFPSQYPAQPNLGGYELPISTDIFRGRYRESFSTPSPVPVNTPQHFRFALPNQNYVFKPGHRIMLQIQSTLFPLYDRNPQTYVKNPLVAGPRDYKKETITIMSGGDHASAIWLPVVHQ